MARHSPRIILYILFCLVAIGLPLLAFGEIQDVKIGILANRGTALCLERWTPTAEYLTTTIPDVRFRIVPLAFEEIDPAVSRGAVDFILANSAIYVELEIKHRVSRIASLKNWNHGKAYGQFGGLIFCRADRTDIKGLTDLRGKTLLAVDPTSFGGWIMALREFKAKGIDPERDFKELRFVGTHDEVVYAVLRGEADAGAVRTDTLERMENEGKIRSEALSVIHDHVDDGGHLPFPHSTRAYPEWPMAKLRHTPDELAEKVASALLAMPKDAPAAHAAKSAGWTIPLNYEVVHDCLRELHLGPYQHLGEVSLVAVARAYWPFILGFFVLFAGVAGGALRILSLKNAINKSYSELHQIFNTAAGGMRMVDNEFRMLSTNNTFLTMLGIKDQDWHGKKCFEVMPGPHCHTDACPLVRIRNGEALVEMEVIKTTPQGLTLTCLLTATPFRDLDGHLLGIIEDFRDITEWKKAEEELLYRKQKEAQQTAMAHSGRMAALGEMATAMAHEINQPLSVISISLQAWAARLKRANLDIDAMLSTDIPRMLSNVERISRLIDHVRTFGRTDSTRHAVDINVMVQDAISLCRHQFKSRGIRLEEHYASQLPLVQAVSTEMEQVVLNLLANARHAVEGKKAAMPDLAALVAVTTALIEDRVTIQVRDNGTGVPREKESFIFDPFFSTKTSTKGTGLGLHISLQIMERFGGGIILHNYPGEGACFEIWLPISGITTQAGQEGD